jgi:hypothetical protein
MAFPAAMTVRTVASGSSRRSWTPSQLNPERFGRVTTARSSSPMRSMIISAKVLTDSPLPGVDIEDGDTALRPSESDAALVRERGGACKPLLAK